MEIEHGPVSQTLSLFLDGTQIGQVTTDGQGNARLKLTAFALPVTVGLKSSLFLQDSFGNVVLSGSINSSKDD